MKQWIVPIAIGIAFGALFLLLPEDAPSTDDAIATSCGEEVKWVFEEGPAVVSKLNVTLLAIGGSTNATWCQPAEPGLPNGTTHATNLTNHGGISTATLQDGRIHCITAPCPQPAAPWLAANPVDGRVVSNETTQVKLELYAFNNAGELVTSTAPAYKLADYTLYGDYFPLSNVWWFIGDGEAPNGTYELPFGQALAAEALQGTPVGGIATIHLESHPYDWLIGDVWITGRLLDLN